MPFFLKNTIFVAQKILTTTDRHLLERAIFIGSCLLHPDFVIAFPKILRQRV